jgi:hypothetical protein
MKREQTSSLTKAKCSIVKMDYFYGELELPDCQEVAHKHAESSVVGK